MLTFRSSSAFRSRLRKVFFSDRLLCRLTYALCLNFLAVIHLDGHVTGAAEQVETSFTKVCWRASNKSMKGLVCKESVMLYVSLWHETRKIGFFHLD